MTDDELRSLFESLRQENASSRGAIDSLRQENASSRAAIDSISKDSAWARDAITSMREENAAAHVETRLHFDVTTEDTKHQIQLVAESVVATRDELHRELTDVREEMRRGFVETQAMMKFSHAELDRRVMALEENRRSVDETIADLQARVERLESSTH